VTDLNQASLQLPAWRGMARLWRKPLTLADERPGKIGVHSFEKNDSNTARPGKLDAMGSESRTLPPARNGLPRHDSSGPRSPLGWVPWLLLGVIAGVGAILAGGTALLIACVVVLACAATALGWRIGEHRRAALEQEIDSRSGELERAFNELEIAQAETVRRLSMAVEFRDEDTGAHIERIGRFSTLLAEQVGMDPDFCRTLSHAAPLHDVGKVAIPDAILLKPGELTPEERAIVETHAEEGHRLLRGSSSSILELAATIALSHHEKWDGSGYPRGAAGEAIPMEGRLVAVADVFDALTSDRVYRRAFTVEEAVEMMLEQRGRHFDPVLLDAFMEVLGRSGPDAREPTRADPGALVEDILETFATALQRGDAETAEGAIAQAIEDGVPAGMVHDEVIEPALRRLAVLKEQGEIDASGERQAMAIARRVLATLRRYMSSGEENAEVLERIDRSVQTVEGSLATPEHAVG
jgi:HD-GYP domain-containing protein (c-di-GMP phosphodiesterase class II)